MLGCSRKKTYQLEDLDENFPKAARDACGTQQWRRKDVLEYIDAMWSKGNGAA
jgi:predicted DNA-binding transcriptional regulator AlpA